MDRFWLMGTPEWNVTLGSEPNNQTVALRWTMIIILNISNRWQWTQIFRQHGGWWLLFLTFQTDDHGQWTQIFRQHGVKQMLRWYKFSSRIQTCQKATTSKGSPWPYKRLLYQHLFHTEGESEKEILSVFLSFRLIALYWPANCWKKGPFEVEHNMI